MSDVALKWSETLFAGDFYLESDDLATEEGLRTAVFLSLFTNRQASPGDVLPAGVSDRRGFWADDLADVEGFKLGSRLWLLDRSKQVPEVLTRAADYAREALQWLVDDRVAKAVSVSAEFLEGARGYLLTVTIQRPAKADIEYKYERLWAAEEARN